MTEDQLTALLQEMKRNSYVTMCQTLESRNAVDIHGRPESGEDVPGVDGRPTDRNDIGDTGHLQKIETKPIVGVTESRIMAGGMVECDVVDFECGLVVAADGGCVTTDPMDCKHLLGQWAFSEAPGQEHG